MKIKSDFENWPFSNFSIFFEIFSKKKSKIFFSKIFENFFYRWLWFGLLKTSFKDLILPIWCRIHLIFPLNSKLQKISARAHFRAHYAHTYIPLIWTRKSVYTMQFWGFDTFDKYTFVPELNKTMLWIILRVRISRDHRSVRIA